ncbi:MAG: GatB/YqeY domain-containing protein [Candidatus Vogelbacteria bacterium]|nr:GatB/YqeY domain-containing protein [Candidatus Vogelbacteria bacterium]
MLHEQIKNEIKQAMLAKDTVKLTVVRGLVAAFTNELVAKRRKPDEILTDEEALVVIRRAAKQHQDSIKQFRAGGRNDLVATETAELEIIKTYL